MRWSVRIGVVLSALGLMASALPAWADADTGVTMRVLELTNAERVRANLLPLALNPQLGQAAQTYAAVLAGASCFEHTCGPVPNFADRVGQAGYTGWTAIGENIAAGYASPEAVVAGWMASPGHRANILSPRFAEVGIGMVKGDGAFGIYWAQEFGAQRPATSADRSLPPPAPQAPAGPPTDPDDPQPSSTGD